MIPALLAAPIVEGVLGQVVGHLMPAQPSTPQISPFLKHLATASAAKASPTTSSSGTANADQWSQWGATNLQAWMQGLVGRHVDVTDVSGRTISGVVSGVQQSGGANALNIGGHIVSLSQLQQVAWNPPAA